MKLRDYQQAALGQIHTSLEDNRSALAVMATGTGKTILFAHLVADRAKVGRAMILTHRQEIISQTIGKLREAVNILADVELAESRADESFFKAPVVVGSIQTQISGRNGRRRMHRFDPSEFNTLIIDEAHHAVSNSYRAAIQHYRQNEELRLVGFTATPDRADERALGMVFDDVPVDYGILAAIKDGWLVEPSVRVVEIEGVNFDTCMKGGGKDFSPDLLARELTYEEPLHAIAQPIIDVIGTRKSVVFAVSIDHAERLAEILNRANIGRAASLCHKTPDDQRIGIMSDYRSGRIRHLVNVGILGEGVDVPDIEAVVQARPTKSRALYMQQLGRGTRPGVSVDGLADAIERRATIAASSKPNLIVLDFVGNAGRHKCVTALDALGGRYDDEVILLAERLAKTGEKPASVALDEAVEEWRRLKEEERSHIKADVKYKMTTANPFDVLDMSPLRQPGWYVAKPASEKQIAVLEKFKIPDADSYTKADASRMIGELIGRSKSKLCTYRQAMFLRRFGYDPTEISFKDAGAILDQKFGKRKR